MSEDTPPLDQQFDAIVVGSGAAGSAIAARLGQAGKRVLIVEAGPERTQADMVSSTLWARRLKWNGAPVLEKGNNAVGHAFNAGFGTGGAALHHYAVWPRMHEEDFDMRMRYGRGSDWPISYAELAPFYDRVQTEAGISGDAEQEKWRPAGAPYPMPPISRFKQGDILAKGFEQTGKSVAPLPLAITTEVYNGRPPCLLDGWCDAGCPIGALANPLTIHLPKALAAGVTIAHDTEVTKVLTDGSGSVATGVEVVADGGVHKTLHADIVVLAAFAIQNPRILLASANEHHPHGLGNSTDNVGRNIMTHLAGLVYGIFDEDTEHYKGAFGGQLVNQDSYGKETHKQDGAFGSYQWMIAQAVKPNDLLGIATSRGNLYGEEFHQFMKRAAKGFASMTAVIEGLPVADNRVTLSEQKDANGTPLAEVAHSTHADSLALWQASLKEGQEVFHAAGAKEVWTGPPGPMHIMGGTVMGDDPATSVTNSFGQVHEIPNLVIAGPGLFPTSAGVNPTFTVHALAVRTSEHLLEDWESITAEP